MSVIDRRPVLRWMVPGVALATIAGFAVLRPAVADASTGLAPLTAQELLVKAQQAGPVPMSGMVAQRLDLGVPELPADLTGRAGSASLASLVSGSHTWRVWYGGPQQARLALLGRSSESDIVRNGPDLWVWSSAEKSARRYVLPAGAASAPSGTSPSAPTAAQRQQHHASLKSHQLPDPTDPGAVADWALRQLDPATVVETTSADQVAGRSAYGLVLRPKASNSLVASVRLVLDGETFTPLAAQVYSTKLDKPAIDVSYTEVSFDKPVNSVFEFTPPPGAEVTTTDLTTMSERAGMPGKHPHGTPGHRAGKQSMNQATPNRPVTSGTGWGSIVAGRLPAQNAAPAPDSSSKTTANPAPEQLLQLLPAVSGPWGSGRVLDGTLFSVVLTDDGRYAAGAVGSESLYAALPQR